MQYDYLLYIGGNTIPVPNDCSIVVTVDLIRSHMPNKTIVFDNTTLDETLHFSLDVAPEQKPIYKSDRFNQKNENQRNGYITRVQGKKTPEEKMHSILPKIRVSYY